jgi:hypothetical protein
MAEIIRTDKDDAGREFYVYDDGSERWAKTGYWKKPAPENQITTSERGRELAAIRKEEKHRAVVEAANLVAQLDAANSNIPAIKALKDDPQAWLKAVTMGRTKSAMDADSPYGSPSASWLIENSGLSEKREEPSDGGLRGVLRDLADIARVRLKELEAGDTVEGEVTDG